MPKSRPPREVWSAIRLFVWTRDGKACIRCKKNVDLNRCHIDHILSGKTASNRFSNLRTLCRSCHVLRADNRHRGMIAKALADGIIPYNWRELVWEG
jgi:5-methylcytosine-specific restriction protein A